MYFDELTNDNFIHYASHHYDNPECKSINEFQEDVNRLTNLRRIITRYLQNDLKDVKVRLIMNHLIIITNVFGVVPGIKMLVFKLEQDRKTHLAIIKPFLEYLNMIPDTVYELKAVRPNKTISQYIKTECEAA